MPQKGKKSQADTKTKQASVSTKGKEMAKKLLAEYPNLWDVASKEDIKKMETLSKEYKSYLDMGKTEREFVSYTISAAEKKGFLDISSVSSLTPGQKVYKSIKGKGLMLSVIGKSPVTDGFNILGAHIDSPRLDLKPNPLYEDNELVFLKTHYYGGVKKYQWPTIPLSIHGLIICSDGTKVFLNIGEKEDDPVFYITDLLPHLGNEQMAKKATDVIRGEDLNLLVGGRPMEDTDVSQRFKLGVLELLHNEYGIVEKDFVSAEIEIVPAMKAKDVGFDRSFIAGYGHDDKVCAYPALAALFDQKAPEKTVVVMLSDKEEIGSYGNTGAQSRLYENFLLEVFSKSYGEYNELLYRKAIENSKLLSADVTNGFDPTFASVSDPRNAAYMSKGVVMEKYTGSRGKSGTNDANAEFFFEILQAFSQKNIPWQTGELGKIDAGGGGTIAVYMAKMGMEVIDCGVPVLAMHSPYELISKMDLYYTYLAYKTFVENL